MNWPSLKLSGENLLAKKFNALVDAVKSQELKPGRGYLLGRGPSGTLLNIQPASPNASLCPFQISVAKGGSDGFIKVTLRPGSVNNLLPTNYADTFTVSDEDLKYVKVKVVTDGVKVTSCELEVNESEPIPQTPTEFSLPTSAQFLIGVVADDVPYKLINCGSILLTGHELYKADKSPPAEPGELPYTPFYVWKPETV